MNHTNAAARPRTAIATKDPMMRAQSDSHRLRYRIDAEYWYPEEINVAREA